jgi:hypothetical protein
VQLVPEAFPQQYLFCGYGVTGWAETYRSVSGRFPRRRGFEVLL